MSAGQAALAIAVMLPLYSTAVVFVARQHGWDLWSSYTIGNACVGMVLAAAITLSGNWASVVGRPPGLGAVGVGIATGAVAALPIVAMSWSPSQLGRNIGQAGVGDSTTWSLLYRLVVQVLLCTVIFEELAFRGVLYALLASSAGPEIVVAIAGSTLSFAFWHTAQLAGMFPGRSPARRAALVTGGLVAYGLLGLGLALLRAGSDALAVPIAAHATLDVVMICGMAAGRRSVRTST